MNQAEFKKISTFKVFLRVETEKIVESFLSDSFANLQDAKVDFENKINDYTGKFGEKDVVSETFVIDEYIKEVYENEEEYEVDIIELDAKQVYFEGLMDRNSYKGNYGSFYYGISEYCQDAKELIYNFYFQGKLDKSLQNIKESELHSKFYHTNSEINLSDIVNRDIDNLI